MFTAEARRKIRFSYINMVLATEFAVNRLGFVFSCDEGVVTDAVDSAYVACFGKNCSNVFVGF